MENESATTQTIEYKGHRIDVSSWTDAGGYQNAQYTCDDTYVTLSLRFAKLHIDEILASQESA